MKAIRVHEFGAPAVMRLEDAPDPTVGPGQILINVKASGVNPVETYIRSGTYARKPALPYTPGSDGAGTVEGVGDGITGCKPGDRVYFAGSLTGSYAQKTLCEAGSVHPLPARTSFSAGAGIGVPYATAYRALFQQGNARAGDWVLVHGASGGVGIASVQFARAAGMRIIGTAGSDSGRALVLQEGAHHALDHHAGGYLDQVMSITGGHGVDIVVEMLANVNLAKDLTVLARKGRVMVVGNRGTIEINARDAMQRDGSIVGVMLFNATEHELASAHLAIGAGLEAGTLRPVVGKEFALADAPRAHEAVMQAGAHGKIVLLP